MKKVANLQELFTLQAKLQKMHGHHFDKMTIEEKENYTKDSILYLLEEAHELLREINFKTYKKVRKPVIQANIEEELCDICHFYVNLCLCWNVSADALIKAFKQKNKKNVKRLLDASY
ncbi:MAG: dUTP diphosphatase [Nitrosarchaeum sp.]|nr:dUTP diphosphatase [Nitrosarchaeum sp.]